MRRKTNSVIKFIFVALIIMVAWFTIGSSVVQELNTSYFLATDSPNRIVQTFYGDTTSQKAFAWYSSKLVANACVQIVPDSSDSKVINLDLNNFKKAVQFKANYRKVKDSFGSEYIYTAVAKGLNPGTKYLFRVGDAKSNLWSQTFGFSTAPKKQESFTFLHITDPQASNITDYNVSFNTIRKAIQVFPTTSFIACTGDFINNRDNEQQWKWAIEGISAASGNRTLTPVTGNHDAGRGVFANHFCLKPVANEAVSTGVYYSFDYSNVHFTILNANTNVKTTVLSKTQVDWLKKDLSTTKKKWKIVLMHQSMFSDSIHRNDSNIIKMRKYLPQLLAKYKVDLVLSGHDHVYLRTVPKYKYTTYIINRTAGTKVYSHYGNGSGVASVENDNLKNSVFSGVTVSANELVYKAYSFDRTLNNANILDTYMVKK